MKEGKMLVYMLPAKKEKVVHIPQIQQFIIWRGESACKKEVEEEKEDQDDLHLPQ